jgi:class 3 adenylate cyclase/tetratricopeptide (TPR) repeat protein
MGPALRAPALSVAMTAGRGDSGLPVTIMFTDVEGSTAMHTAKGDIEARRLLVACGEVVLTESTEQGGRVIKSTGDGFMIAFSSPRCAVRCALGIKRALAEHRQRDPDRGLRVRAGVHTGEVVEEDGDLHGAAVAAAARICAKAQGGEVLVSAVVRELCGTLPEAVFRDRGHLTLKGFPGRWHLFRVISTADDVGVITRTTPFVGRTAQRAQLTGLLERAADGRGSLVMVAGEAGVGKTRFVEELARDARERGDVFIGHCYGRDSDLPYMPWVEILEAGTRQLSQKALLRTLGEQAPAIAQMVPELRQRAPRIDQPIELPPEQQRRYLFNSVRDFLARLARNSPKILILEDLQWADASTLSLLEHLVEAASRLPVLMIATHRERMDASPSLAASLPRLARDPNAHLMTLARHSKTEVAMMLRLITAHTPPAAVTDAIYAESDGNAFFVEEVFRHLAQSGTLLDEEGRFRAALDLDELQVPQGVQLILGARLLRLSAPARRMLAVASVIGRQFTFATLAAALRELTGEQVLDAIEESRQADFILEEQSGSQARYSFVHELIRQTLNARLSTPRRQLYHLRVADALELVHADNLELHAADIAQHLIRSGDNADPERAARYLTLAGDRRLAAAAYEAAQRNYDQALAILPSEDTLARARLRWKVGLTQRSLGRWDDAVASWNEALAMVEHLGELDVVAALCWDLAQHLLWAYRFPEGIEIARRGLSAVRHRDSPQRARLLAITGLGYTLAGQPETAREHLAEARRLADREANQRIRGDVGLAKATHHYIRIELPETVEAAREAAGYLRDAGSLWNLAETLTWLDVALAYQGRFSEADEVHRELAPLFDRLGHVGAASTAYRTRLVISAARDADLRKLEEILEQESKVLPETDSQGWVAHSHSLKGIVAFWRGDWAQARIAMEEGIRLGGALWVAAQHGCLLVLRAYSGERDAVHAHLEQLESALPRAGRPILLGTRTLAIFAAEAVGIVGSADRARALYPLVVEALSAGSVMRRLDGRLIQTIAGVVATTAGHWEAADRHLKTALAQAEELPHLLERPHARHSYAWFLLKRGAVGDEDRAVELLREAIDGYLAIGMPRHASLARELLDLPGVAASESTAREIRFVQADAATSSETSGSQTASRHKSAKAR